MKKLALLLSFAVSLVFLGASGCSSKPEVSTELTQKSFANASEEDRAKVQKGLDAANAGDYATALAILEDLQYELLDISAEQQSALMDLVQQLNDRLGENAEAAVEAARAKLEDAEAAAQEAVESATETAEEEVNQAAEALKSDGQ